MLEMYKPKKHDKKVSIGSGSILSEMSSDISIIYFIIFGNFILRNNINVTYRNCGEFELFQKII